MATAAKYDQKSSSYANHVTHILNIPNPDQIQYTNYSHAEAWTFNKEQKCKSKINLK